MTHLRCIQNIFPLSLKKTVLCSHAYCRKLWIKLGIPMFFIIRMQRWEFIKYHSQKNTENIFILVIMMPNGKERKITFKKIFIWKKKSFDVEWKKNVLFPSGFCVKIVDVEFSNNIHHFSDKLICTRISHLKLQDWRFFLSRKLIWHLGA